MADTSTNGGKTHLETDRPRSSLRDLSWPLFLLMYGVIVADLVYLLLFHYYGK